ncbi:hypothetical protein SJI45_18830 [Streptomyces sp. S399]|uniref:hypothetical protein n=1 Tax=Streptomyces sp. S399 TaxID=3096009 RepID=UPI002A804479|nr:hypothetical protein [Streptomyces sp. S399]WPR52793.1 hypothetical protein SJI45_18830 [Streptomyces sp. S399]
MARVECGIARLSYKQGKTGVEIAEQWIVVHLDALLDVTASRAQDPKSFPDFGTGSSQESARRIIARLLDAGWRPPDTDCLDLPQEPPMTQPLTPAEINRGSRGGQG